MYMMFINRPPDKDDDNDVDNDVGVDVEFDIGTPSPVPVPLAGQAVGSNRFIISIYVYKYTNRYITFHGFV